MNNAQPVIAVLDDEVQMRKALGRLLRTHGFCVETFAAGGEMLTAFSKRVPDCLLLDLQMPGMNGFEVMENLHIWRLQVPVIVITGHDEPQNCGRVLALGASSYLTKPIDEFVLLKALRRALDESPGQLPGYRADFSDEA